MRHDCTSLSKGMTAQVTTRKHDHALPIRPSASKQPQGRTPTI